MSRGRAPSRSRPLPHTVTRRSNSISAFTSFRKEFDICRTKILRQPSARGPYHHASDADRSSSKPLLLLYCTMNPIGPAPGRLQALWVSRRRRRLTLFGRSAILVGCELLANATCWIVAGILFGGHENTQPILGLGLLAWVCMPILLSCQRITHHKLLFRFPLS